MSSNKSVCVGVEEARQLVTDPRYVIDEFIGQGAMACVYKVHEHGTPNVYALKLLREQYRQNQSFLQIFEREAHNMRDLQYPNIVRFYKFVNEDDSAYILMDFVDGKPLTDYIKQARHDLEFVPLDKIVRVMAQVARAISYIHTEGFIHRDIKPGNILLAGENESAYLTDLGIAGAVDDPSMDGAGTPSYMPYEQQIRNKIDRTADVYAFAVMLFELFTGQKPFRVREGLPFSEARKEMVELHRKQSVPSISARRSDLPDVLDAYFERAMAKSPSDRYGDILDFVKDIHEALLPQLSPDLRNFDLIQPQKIQPAVIRERVEVPKPQTNSVLIYSGIIAVVIAVLATIFFVMTANMPAEIVATSVPVPDEFVQVRETVIAEGDETLLFGGFGADSIGQIARIRDGIVPLRLQTVQDNYRVRVQFDDAVGVPYGMRLNYQDDSNWIRFEVADERLWRLLVYRDGEEVVVQDGILNTLPTEINLSVLEDRLYVGVGDDVIIEEALSELPQIQDVALWFGAEDSSEFAVDSVTIIALDDAVLDLAMPVDYRQLVVEDIEALIATVTESDFTVDCSAFNRIFDRFDNHNEVDTVSELANEVRQASAFVSSRCQNADADTVVEVSLSDTLAWDEALNGLIDDDAGSEGD